MPADILAFPEEPARARPAEPAEAPVLLETLPGREGERLCVYRLTSGGEPRLRLVWERHARDIGWYRLRSLELSRDQAGQLQRLLGAVDLTPSRCSRQTVRRLRDGSSR